MTAATLTIRGLTDVTTDAAAPAGAARAVGDGELVARLARGDRTAFAALVDSHVAAVHRVAGRVLGSAADAEDVAQEAFMRLWRAPHQIRDGAAVRGWLMRVATNLAIDRVRRVRPDLGIDIDHVADAAAGADKPLRRSAVSAAVEAALAGLPERQRAALVLTYYEGFGNQETAEALGVSVEAVESLLARARRSLRQSLAGEWRDLLHDLDGL